MRRTTKRAGRQGAVVPLFVFLLIPLLAMMALAIDIGYVCLAKTELQNAADAAALAAAETLQSYFVQYNLPGQTHTDQIREDAKLAATAMAKKFSASNTAGGVNISLLDSDITFGFLDGSGNYTSPYSGFPNSVSLIVRRDGVQNKPVDLFFANVLGISNMSIQANARGTIYTGDVSTLNPSPLNAMVLPIALDVNIWQTFYATGLSPDGNRHPGPNGAWQLQVYPVPKNAPGNFSLLNIGPPSNDAGAFRSWIDNGMAPSDIQYLLNSQLLPVSPSAPESWKAGPGMTSTLVSNFADIVGKSNLVPLFKPVSTSPYQAATGTGQNATYQIIGFASVIVSEVANSGSNLTLSIQPSAILDTSAVILNPVPAGTQNSTSSGTSSTTFVPPKLTN